jgi:hypothetical protein
VITPVTIHAASSQNGEPRLRAMLAETMKMPDPIIEPATSIVASVSVIALTNSGLPDVGFVDPEVVLRGAATLVIQLLVNCTETRVAVGKAAGKLVKNRAIVSGALLASQGVKRDPLRSRK